MKTETDVLFEQYISHSRKEKKRNKRLIRLGSLVLILFILSNFIGIGKIQSDSMEPEFQQNHLIIYSKYNNHYESGDVVVINYENNILIRRVIGVYGDKIDIDNEQGIVLINDSEENDDYREGLTLSDPLGIKFPIVVSQKQVFVLCDQRDVTTDSRKMGCINYKNIVGKVILKL